MIYRESGFDDEIPACAGMRERAKFADKKKVEFTTHSHESGNPSLNNMVFHESGNPKQMEFS